MVSTDFRIGFPLTHREGPWEFKFGYYHLSSHLGDLYMVSHPDVMRLNYVREQLVFGVAYRPIPDLRFYGEANWAFHEDGGSQPWEFQFGIDYSPAQPNGFYGAPFAAINSKIEEDLNYSGNVTFEAGWQWRGPTGHTLRTGLEYFDGYSFQRQFYNQLPAVHRGRGLVRFLTVPRASRNGWDKIRGTRGGHHVPMVGLRVAGRRAPAHHDRLENTFWWAGARRLAGPTLLLSVT